MIPILDNGLASMLLGKKTQHLFFTVLGILRLHAYKSNTLPYLSRYNVLQWVQCTHVALNSWDNPIGEMDGLFHEVRVFHTTRGHKTEGEQENITFFYGKMATLGWDPDMWQWVEGCHFLEFTMKIGRYFITKGPKGLIMSQTNGKATFLGITNSIGHKYGILCRLGRKPRSCGQYGIKR